MLQRINLKVSAFTLGSLLHIINIFLFSPLLNLEQRSNFIQPTKVQVDHWNAVKKPNCQQKHHPETSGTQFPRMGLYKLAKKISLACLPFGLVYLLSLKHPLSYLVTLLGSEAHLPEMCIFPYRKHIFQLSPCKGLLYQLSDLINYVFEQPFEQWLPEHNVFSLSSRPISDSPSSNFSSGDKNIFLASQ